ncbi:ABC transporter substrate-binding protein [Bordetella sputigena]|uniref:Bug family tripartite tricarboxylate transporter substrate binding protein n=1 Tax=Bordetella sputigena TaxID=1416810 RepID=UPI0039EE903C
MPLRFSDNVLLAMPQRRRVLAGLAAGLALGSTGAAPALAAPHDYPAKPITIVVPFPAGGASDILARLIGQKLSERWKQSVVVENRPGASGNIGAAHVARSRPDGYTLAFMDLTTLAISPSFTKLSYTPTKDLAPVSMVTFSPHLLVVRKDLPVNNVGELLAYAKEHPGRLSFGATPGTITQLAGVLLAQKAGISWTYIGYKGGAQVTTDLVGGHIDVIMNSVLGTYALVDSQQVKMLAVASAKPFYMYPGTPTIAQTIPDFVTGTWQGLLAPAGTPKAIVQQLHDEVALILKEPDVMARLRELGCEPLNETPEHFGQWLREQTVYWAGVIKENNVKAD